MFHTIIFKVNSFSNMYINLALTCVAHTLELYLILCNSRQLIHIVLIIHSFTVLGYLKGLLVTVNTFRILFNKSYTNLINILDCVLFCYLNLHGGSIKYLCLDT